MKITNQPSSINNLWSPQKNSGNQRPGFQAAIASCTSLQELQDTLELSTLNGTGYVPPIPDFSGMSDSRKLAVIQRLHEQTDYSGMTEAEKYKTISERFSAAFDQLTLHTGIFGWPRTEKIVQVFDQQCKDVGIDSAYMGRVDYKLHKEAFYSGMSDDEIKSAVYSKYDGSLLYDRLSALNELRLMKLDGGAFIPALNSYMETTLQACRQSNNYEGAFTDNPSEIAYIRKQMFNTSMSWTELYDLTLSAAQKWGGTLVSPGETVPTYDVVKKMMDEVLDDVMNLGN